MVMYRERDEAAKYVCQIIGNDVLMIKCLLEKISMAPDPVGEYLDRHCRDEKELEEFLKDNSYLFFVKNKRVTSLRDQDELYSQAVEFCKTILGKYTKPIDYNVLKLIYYEKAPDRLKTVISFFYPGIDFKCFLKSEPDVFVVHSDQTVFLIETESVEFYRERLLRYGQERMRFMNFRGHIGAAPKEVQQFMNRNYPYDDFQIFLKKHGDVFVVDDSGYVSLVSPS